MQAAESSQHLFFHCPVTFKLWDWLGKGTDQVLDCSSCLTFLLSRLGTGSKLVQKLMNSAIIHTLWAIWIERNPRYYSNKKQAMSTLFNTILAEVKVSYSLCLATGNSSMQDYKVARLFSIPFKVKRATPSQEIIWKPPDADTVKLNCDGSSFGNSPCGSIGVVIRDANSTILGAISSNIGHATPLEAEFCAVMVAIERAKSMHLLSICLETDSIKVVAAFSKDIGIPWKFRARWHNCM
jgi:hypothetical protein